MEKLLKFSIQTILLSIDLGIEKLWQFKAVRQFKRSVAKTYPKTVDINTL